jgi:hypothetical protein
MLAVNPPVSFNNFLKTQNGAQLPVREVAPHKNYQPVRLGRQS